MNRLQAVLILIWSSKVHVPCFSWTDSKPFTNYSDPLVLRIAQNVFQESVLFHLLCGSEAAFNVFFRDEVGKDEVVLIYDANTYHPGTTLATLSLDNFHHM